MLLIIDGYNLLFHEDCDIKGGTLEAQRDHLVYKLSQYQHRHREARIIVIFDGRVLGSGGTGVPSSRGIEIMYAQAEGGADDAIVALVRRLGGATVVTSDRKLAQRVKSFQTVIISSADFLKEMYHAAGEKPASEDDKPGLRPPQSEQEVQEWLQIFGLKPEIELPPPGKEDRRNLPKKAKGKRPNPQNPQ